jgi:cysteine desulfuration protein SufE
MPAIFQMRVLIEGRVFLCGVRRVDESFAQPGICGYTERVTLAEHQRALIAKLAIIEDAHERLAAITSRAKKWPVPAESERIDERLVRGCSSRVWLVGEVRDGRCHFRVDGDSTLMKGLAALLCEVYEGGTPEEVVAVEPEIIAGLGIDRMLSPTRLNGLAAVRNTIREFAAAHA